MAFTRATKRQSKLRLALIGPSGCGKTYTALTLAGALGEKVAVIDTEHGSASKYADLFGFDVEELDSFAPAVYVKAIREAEAAGYDVLVIDSLSHAWMGKDGALEQVDRAAKRSQSGNSFAAWRDVTPQHNALVEAMIASRLHLIVTMRAKMEYSQEKDSKGKTIIRKVGLAPIQRDGLEYEFDVVADMDLDNTLMVSKTRCPALNGAIIEKPDASFADVLKAWLSDGAEYVAPPRPVPPAPAPAPTNGGNGAQRQAPPPPPQGEQDGDKPRRVTFQGVRYGRELPAFINQVPYFQNERGAADGYHIEGVLRKFGIFAVNDSNIDNVWTVLRQHAEDKEAVKNAPEPQAETTPLFEEEPA